MTLPAASPPFAIDGQRFFGNITRVMNVSGEPITKCPVCRYDLTGLSKSHTCPECGFAYDESMRIWVWHQSLKDFFLVPMFLVCGFPFVFVITLLMVLPGDFFALAQKLFRAPARILGLISLLFIPALLFLALFYFVKYVLRSRTPFVIVSNSGLYIRRFPLVRTESFAWNEITLSGRGFSRMHSESASRQVAVTSRLPRRNKLAWFGFLEMLTYRILIRRPDGARREFVVPMMARSFAMHRELLGDIYGRWSNANHGSEKSFNDCGNH